MQVAQGGREDEEDAFGAFDASKAVFAEVGDGGGGESVRGRDVCGAGEQGLAKVGRGGDAGGAVDDGTEEVRTTGGGVDFADRFAEVDSHGEGRLAGTGCFLQLEGAPDGVRCLCEDQHETTGHRLHHLAAVPGQALPEPSLQRGLHFGDRRIPGDDAGGGALDFDERDGDEADGGSHGRKRISERKKIRRVERRRAACKAT